MRINVTGNAGSGKSTLARQLSQALDLPLIEMDLFIWKPGWEKVPLESFKTALGQHLRQDSWVLDGVSRMARQQADLIIFLDFPRGLCAWRCLKRNCRYLFRSRPGIPEGCPEWKILPTLAQIIWQFPHRARPTILREMETLDAEAIIIRSTADLTNFMERLLQPLASKEQS